MPRNEGRLTRLRKAMVAMVTPTREAASAMREFGVSAMQVAENVRTMRKALAVPADVLRAPAMRANEATLSGNRYTVQALEQAAQQINAQRADVQGMVLEGLRAEIANSGLQEDFDRRMFAGLTDATMTVTGTDQDGAGSVAQNVPIPEETISWRHIDAAQEALSKAESAGQPRTAALGRLMPELRREFIEATFARSAWINPPRTEHDADRDGRRRRYEARERLRAQDDNTGPTLREILEANGCNTDPDARYTPQQQVTQTEEGPQGTWTSLQIGDEVHYAR